MKRRVDAIAKQRAAWQREIEQVYGLSVPKASDTVVHAAPRINGAEQRFVFLIPARVCLPFGQARGGVDAYLAHPIAAMDLHCDLRYRDRTICLMRRPARTGSFISRSS